MGTVIFLLSSLTVGLFEPEDSIRLLQKFNGLLEISRSRAPIDGNERTSSRSGTLAHQERTEQHTGMGCTYA